MTASNGAMNVMVGPIIGSFVSNGTSVTLSPEKRYSEKPVSIAKFRVRLTPTPRIENGLIGTEKYPFFGKKNENETPMLCACANWLLSVIKMIVAMKTNSNFLIGIMRIELY